MIGPRRVEIEVEYSHVCLLVNLVSILLYHGCRCIAPRLKNWDGSDGGADTVIDALLDVLGSGGNLVLPTFSYARYAFDSCFDPSQTPCKTGILNEVGRQWKGAVRSLHPTHSIAVIGPEAVRLTKGHLEHRTFGVGSPLDRIASEGGKILLLGVPQTTNSMIHVAEEHAGAPKVSRFDPLPVVRVRRQDGRIIDHQLDTSPSCSAGFEAAELPLRINREISDHRIGGALCKLIRGADIVRRVVETIRENPDALLRTDPDCVPCTGARKNLGLSI